MILAKTYFPAHMENRMKNEGDLESAREFFLKHRPTNLNFLLTERYGWMNPYLEGKEKLIEVGAGAGFSKEFITNKNLKITDFKKYPWIDQEVDALNPPFESNSLDAVIASHMIHHLAQPLVFFRQIQKVLKPGGYLLIHEVQTSFLMRILLRVMRHEGWSYDVDVFNEKTIANDPKDPWSANCAIPELLFTDSDRFEKALPGLKIVKNELCETFIFPLSGGVIAKAKTLPLPIPVLKLVNHFDRLLVALFPGVFALGRRIVIQKI